MRKRKRKKKVELVARGKAVLQLSDDVRLAGVDDDNWQLEILTSRTRDDEVVQTWKRVGYFSKTRDGLDAAVKRALDIQLRRGPGHDLQSWLEVHDRFLVDLTRVCRGVTVVK